MSRAPVYFLSHGGPNLVYDTDHPAYAKLQSIGKEITEKVKPKAVVVFSAHWQAGEHQVEETFPNVGSKGIATAVVEAMEEAGVDVKAVERGLDHGVWTPFRVAFDPDRNPLKVPIIQASLFASEDPHQHYQLGQAVAKLRSQNILIIVSGMAVHNLGDWKWASGIQNPLPYTTSFDEALKQAVEAPPSEREKAMADLLKRADARQAHPDFDHILPIFIGAGAAGEDVGQRLWTLKERSMSWAQYRFGAIAA
ncbi:MAG: hypothetical protein Q9201_004981 [Fulgogasparrea decipioides]